MLMWQKLTNWKGVDSSPIESLFPMSAALSAGGFEGSPELKLGCLGCSPWHEYRSGLVTLPWHIQIPEKQSRRKYDIWWEKNSEIPWWTYSSREYCNCETWVTLMLLSAHFHFRQPTPAFLVKRPKKSWWEEPDTSGGRVYAGNQLHVEWRRWASRKATGLGKIVTWDRILSQIKTPLFQCNEKTDPNPRWRLEPCVSKRAGRSPETFLDPKKMWASGRPRVASMVLWLWSWAVTMETRVLPPPWPKSVCSRSEFRSSAKEDVWNLVHTIFVLTAPAMASKPGSHFLMHVREDARPSSKNRVQFSVDYASQCSSLVSSFSWSVQTRTYEPMPDIHHVLRRPEARRRQKHVTSLRQRAKIWCGLNFGKDLLDWVQDVHWRRRVYVTTDWCPLRCVMISSESSLRRLSGTSGTSSATSEITWRHYMSSLVLLKL